MGAFSNHSVFIFGVRRVETALVGGANVPVQIDATNRPDLFGKLDPSAVPSPGKNWGIRTNSNSFAQFQACPLSAGASITPGSPYSDNWGQTSQLTMEFCVEPPDGNLFPVNTPLLGCGGSDPLVASPLFFGTWSSPTKFLAIFRTGEMDDGAFRAFSITLSGQTPPYRFVIQLDLINAVCTAFVNGVQVAIGDPINLSPTSTPPFAPGLGLKLATNDHYPFMIGMNGFAAPFTGSTGLDLRLYGLRLSNTLRYQNNGPGQPQKRTDSPTTPVNDAWAYFGNDANTVCYLPGTDNPATSGRVVSVQHGNAVLPGTSSGIFLHSMSPHNISNNAIRDIKIWCSTGYGQAVSIGNIVEMTIEGVTVYGGFNGIGSFNMTANYFVHMSDCNLDAFDSPYYSYKQLVNARDITFNTSGRVAVRHLGSGACWENVMVARSSPVVECVFKARATDYGGNFILSNWNVDFEGDTLTRAAIYCEAHGQTAATSLTMSNIFLGTVGASASLVQLKDNSNVESFFHKCWLSVDNLQAYTATYLAAFDVDGPLWHGEVRGVSLGGTRLYHRQKWGTNTNLAIYEPKYVAPPRELSWYNGAPILQVRSPAESQYSEWRCLATGTYGTPTPPTWVGLTPISAYKNGLAAYVLNTGYMTVALS
jgi:hypothetical protein